jgi:2-polyprenyl-3-methyl-5-hydroxy-6-metoxy-1,4-benzoquinol methylase
MKTASGASERVSLHYDAHFRRIGNSAATVEAPFDASDDKTLSWTPSDRTARIVDVGCGWANRLRALHAMGYTQLTGLDSSAAMIAGAREHNPPAVRLVERDAIAYFRETNERFDRILLFDILEHFAWDEGLQLLDACRSHLAPQGMIVVQVPNFACVTTAHMHFSDITHKQGYTEFSLAQLFDTAGLTPDLVCPAPRFSFARWRPWRPLRGTTLAWRANRYLHRALYRITNVGPEPRCYCPTLLMLGTP